MRKFLRRTSNRYSKLGRKRKKKQVWRKPKGRDNKMREKRRGYPAVVSIGYKKGKHKTQIIINNVKDLEKKMKKQGKKFEFFITCEEILKRQKPRTTFLIKNFITYNFFFKIVS